MNGIPLSFLFQDQYIFAIDKPAQIHSVAQANSTEHSVADELLKLNADLMTASPKPGDAGLINRLDFETSGILLGAYSREIWNQFSVVLKSDLVRKTYLVLLEGKLGNTETLRTWIGSPNRRAKKMRVYRGEPEKSERALPAESEIRPIVYDEQNDVTAAEVVCESARRHQIRAHCAYVKHPLVGDTLYGAKRGLMEVFPGASHRSFFLHAARSDFKHPITGTPMTVISKPEAVFEERFQSEHS